VTVDRKQPNRPYRGTWEARSQEFYPGQRGESRGGAGYAVVFLMLLALAVLCVAGFLVVRLLLPGSSPAILPKFETWTPSPTAGTLEPSPTALPPTPVLGEAMVSINPEQGYINTLVTVTGQGWWPGEPVFVFLRSKEEGDGRGYSYAAAVADEQGNMRTALTFPNELRWIGQEWADVIARGTRSGREASTRFTLVAPTPTATQPPPTPRPTLLPTHTPLPTNTPLPTATPEPTFTPTPELVITDWRGEYYANPTLAGEPVLVRNDVNIDFNWGEGSPDPRVPIDRFSARWTRQLRFSAGSYQFVVSADDGVRLWIDSQLLIDQWHDGPFTPYVAEIDLAKGRHTLQLEYYENFGGAAVELTWDRSDRPTATPTSQPSLPGTWHGEYYDNPDLSGQPVFAREDAEVDFDWGLNSPGDGIPADNFSVRWTQDMWMEAATYRFRLQVDDGVRFWVDGALLVDEWHPNAQETYRADLYLPAGVHRFKIEYNELSYEASIHYRARVTSP
jgi:hypothetical protein